MIRLTHVIADPMDSCGSRNVKSWVQEIPQWVVEQFPQLSVKVDEELVAVAYHVPPVCSIWE